MQVDLIAHVLAGYVAVSVAGQPPAKVHPLTAFTIGVAAGVAKEVWDSRRGGSGFDPRDLLATVAGSGMAVVQIRW